MKAEIDASIESIKKTHKMTSREAQTFDLLVEGRSDLEIGKRLDISTATAQRHVSRVLAKLRDLLGDRNRAAVPHLVIEHLVEAHAGSPVALAALELVAVLREAGVDVDRNTAQSWGPEKRARASTWAMNKIMRARGIPIDIPKKPSFLPKQRKHQALKGA